MPRKFSRVERWRNRFFLSLLHQENLNLLEFFREFLKLPRKFSVVERWRKRNDFSMANISGIFVIATPAKFQSA
ncbi:hypothetical protein [Hydrocoleum sp. CS-953]|uniref:hypothetical protein n=1 Tax=Hydrocoleum sp. CS-953 TaxID=1671698 RepID=UPI00117A5BB6|nr:hypothetical protein [Hydrocoleum sp. CS-953]